MYLLLLGHQAADHLINGLLGHLINSSVTADTGKRLSKRMVDGYECL
jgi:hypothetical protein